MWAMGLLLLNNIAVNVACKYPAKIKKLHYIIKCGAAVKCVMVVAFPSCDELFQYNDILPTLVNNFRKCNYKEKKCHGSLAKAF